MLKLCPEAEHQDRAGCRPSGIAEGTEDVTDVSEEFRHSDSFPGLCRPRGPFVSFCGFG